MVAENTASECTPKRIKFVTRAKFAKMCGVGRQTVYMAIRSGRVFESGVGRKISLTNEVNLAYLKKCQYRKKIRDADKEKIKEQQANGVVSNPTPTVIPKKNLENPPSNFKDPPEVSRIEDMATRKIRAGVEAAELKLDEARGRVVKRKDVELLFGRIHSVDVQEFHTFAQRMGPILAAACGIEDPKLIIKISTILNDEIFKSLAHIKSHIDKFLEEHEVR